MARIRRIHITGRTKKVNTGENSESEIENSTKTSKLNVVNSRKIRLIEKSRKIYENLKNYTSYFNNINDLTISNKKTLSCPILSNMNDRNWMNYDSKITQTSENDILESTVRIFSNSSTQTEPLIKDERDIEHPKIETTEVNTLSINTSPCRCKSQVETPSRKYADSEIKNEEFSTKINLSSRNRELSLITKHTNQKTHKKGMTPSRIPIPMKYLQNNKNDEIKQRYRKKRNLFLKKKLRKSKHSHYVRNSIEKLNNLSNYECKLSLRDEFINKMQKYSYIITKWSIEIFKIFSDIGISLKKSLINIYKLYEAQSAQYFNFCECDRYRQEVVTLTAKIKELELQVKSLNIKTEDTFNNTDKYQEIFKKLDKIDRDVESFATLKTEVTILKKQVEGKTVCSKSCMPPLPPPPPPPPPLPPPPNISHSTNFTRAVQEERKTIRFEESRPIITLEDILKVKLKKISVE